jgi:hypothetical protein
MATDVVENCTDDARASEPLGVITAEQLEASRHDTRVIALRERAREHRAELIRQGRLL